MIGPWKVELGRQLSVEMSPYRIDLANNNAGGAISPRNYGLEIFGFIHQKKIRN